MSDSDEAQVEATHRSTDPVIGLTVSGFRIGRRLGVGGMGIVYEGEHPTIGKRAAIKVLRHEVADKPELVQRLIDEARAVNKVGHRGLVDVFGFNKLPDGRQCIVMEYLEGEPLEDALQKLVRTNRRLPMTDVLVILDEVLSALGAAHDAGVIHRDLKPSNIFLCQQRDGTRYVKVLDFGIAKLGVSAAQQNNASVVIGTPTYMAPEQARQGAVGPALDLYALGIMTFELVTGRPPFMGDSMLEVIMMHAQRPPPHLEDFVEDVPPGLDGLVQQLLEKRPEDRPASAELVRQEVNRIRRRVSLTPSAIELAISPPRPSGVSFPAIKPVESVQQTMELPPVPLPVPEAAPLQPAPETNAAPVVATRRRPWLWGVAAVLLVGLGLSAGALRESKASSPVAEPVREPPAVPPAATSPAEPAPPPAVVTPTPPPVEEPPPAVAAPTPSTPPTEVEPKVTAEPRRAPVSALEAARAPLLKRAEQLTATLNRKSREQPDLDVESLKNGLTGLRTKLKKSTDLATLNALASALTRFEEEIGALP